MYLRSYLIWSPVTVCRVVPVASIIVPAGVVSWRIPAQCREDYCFTYESVDEEEEEAG